MARNFLSINFLAALASIAIPCALALSPEDTAYFESKIRPILVENCYKCHSAEGDKIRGGFRIDSQPGMLRGGESGPSIVPGDATNSRLTQMIQRHPDFEAMPPKSKLDPQDIETLMAWIDRGAPDPRIEEPEAHADESEFDLEERKKWWSLQPVERPEVPTVSRNDWPANEYDAFLLEKLESKGWEPARETDKATLLRRLSFDLTGLAPTRSELQAFLKDDSSGAYEKQVDRLLASPRFGEKWARHWMDLVRFAESKSFEQDYTMPYAYRYRDYLINAFNADLPYDQFIVEALAGDLLNEPRIDPKTGVNQSIAGPGYLYLTDGQHGPPDVHEDEARIFDGMIDVTTKAFLGTTVACARCHDHKFDAVSTEDYYSFYGMLRSSRLAITNTVPESIQKKTLGRLEAKKKALQSKLYKSLEKELNSLPNYLAASNAALANPSLSSKIDSLLAEEPKSAKGKAAWEKRFETTLRKHSVAIASSHNLEADALYPWLDLKLRPEASADWPEIAAWLLEMPTESRSTRTESELSQSFADVASELNAWIPQGLAFENRDSKPGKFVLENKGQNVIQTILGTDLSSGQLAPRVSGALRSPDFILDGKPIEFQAKGKYASARLVVRNYELTGRGPTTAKLYVAIDSDAWKTFRMETYLWEGQPAYFEIFQNGQATHSVRPKDKVPEYNDNAYLSIRFEDSSDWNAFWNKRGKTTEAFIRAIEDALEAARSGKADNEAIDLLAACIGSGILQPKIEPNSTLGRDIAAYQEIALQIPKPRFVRSLTDGVKHAEPVYIRGSHKNLASEGVERRFLDGLGGAAINSQGSGRLEWARHVADPNNPLTARVLVNRLWKHLFGAGIASTTNDLGVMGFAPTHPELLDYLAADLVDQDWSIKSMIRKMVLTRAYRMDSTPSETAKQEDPKNELLQRMPVKRLEAEAIRDHILACSGELDTSMFGPSVDAYVGDYPKSRAIPNGGPVDGMGRRSIYLEMRRSFLPTFLRAFDMPNATESTGERQVTNVPAQSLALMNDPFVHEQATAWATRILDAEDSFDQRIDQIHIDAFSRPATAKEKAWSRRFIDSLSSEYENANDAWTDLCHMIYNRKEFIYVF